MQYLNDTGLSARLQEWHKNGKTIYGICGGYQIMGEEILDPLHIEGKADSIKGLGILPVVTTLTKDKNSTQSHFKFLNEQGDCEGYEIHMGITTFNETQKPVATLKDGFKDGFYKDEKTWGTYLHGIFDNAVVLQNILEPFVNKKLNIINYKEFKNTEYDKLANFVREHLDMEMIYKELKA